MAIGDSALTLGIDLGSGGVKGLLLRSDGVVVGIAETPLVTSSPSPGHAEQRPDDWLTAVGMVVADLIDQHPEAPGHLAAIGVCGAAHIPVLYDGKGQTLRPAIMWNDQRSHTEAQALLADHGESILKVGGNQPSPTWTLPQLQWLQRHERDVHRRIEQVLLGKDVVVHHLTGRRCTDEGNAASSLLMEVSKREWSPWLLDLAGVSVGVMPEIVPPDEIVGPLRADVAGELGLNAGTPVVAGGLDSVMELLALGVIRPDQAMLRLGTAGGVMAPTTSAGGHPSVITYPFLDRGWARQAFTSSFASSIRWFRDLLDPRTTERAAPSLPLGNDHSAGDDGHLSFEVLEALAAKAPVGSDGLIFHPYLAGERAPHWDPTLRGSFTGIAMHHGRHHFARAVMEGLACSVKDCLDVLRGLGHSIDELRTTGGASRSDLLSQIVSDVLELPLRRSQAEGSALGVAMLAAVSVGIFDDIEQAALTCVVDGEAFHPNHAAGRRYRTTVRFYRDVIDALRPVYHGHDAESSAE